MTIKELYDAIGGDYDAAFSRLMSEKFISKYIVKFLKDPSYSELMEEWHGDKNPDELLKKSHSLKGVCANLAIDKLFNTASIITDNYRTSGAVPVDNIEEQFDKLEADYNDVVALIQEYALEHPVQ